MYHTSLGSRNRDDTQCRNCGSFVSRRFALVFGDNDNTVYGCHECMSATELYNGESVQAD